MPNCTKTSYCQQRTRFSAGEASEFPFLFAHCWSWKSPSVKLKSHSFSSTSWVIIRARSLKTIINFHRNLGHHDLFQKLTLSDKKFEAFLQNLKVLFFKCVFFCGSSITPKKKVCRKNVRFQVETFFKTGVFEIKINLLFMCTTNPHWACAGKLAVG